MDKPTIYIDPIEVTSSTGLRKLFQPGADGYAEAKKLLDEKLLEEYCIAYGDQPPNFRCYHFEIAADATLDDDEVWFEMW